MPGIYMGIPGSGSRLRGRLFLADFTALASGAASTLFGLSHTRGSSATVQTGTSTVYSSLGVDVAGIGRALDADALGVVIEEARTNLLKGSRDYSATYWSNTAGSALTLTADAAAGPDGTTAADRIAVTAAGYANVQFIAASVGTLIQNHGWVKQASATTSYQPVLNWTGVKAFSGNAGAAWAKVGTFWTMEASGQVGFRLQDGRDQSANGGIASGARDAYFDLWQAEAGRFATETIVTTSTSLTRSGARLWHPSLSSVVRAGRLELRMVLQAKGAHTDYASSPYLWRVDASNYATISNVDGKVTIVINGASYTTASGITWAQGDVLDVRVMAGGGSANSVVKIGKNGGALSTLGTSGAAQAALPASGTLDLLQDGSAANVFSSRLRSLATYAPGVLLGVA